MPAKKSSSKMPPKGMPKMPMMEGKMPPKGMMPKGKGKKK